MEYQYIDIEAHIRNAHKLRSEALSELLGTAWKRCAQWFAHLAHRQSLTPAASSASSVA